MAQKMHYCICAYCLLVYIYIADGQIEARRVLEIRSVMDDQEDVK